jgi:hypothetical protein
MTIKSVYDFLESPLVVWSKSILNLNINDQFDYENFPNGQYFFMILKQCDPRLQNLCMPNEGDPYDTVRSRLLNLDFILRNTRLFYQEILNHILLIKLPDIYQIAKYPESEQTFKEMEKILLILLGIAINGDLKETFIDQIQQKLDTQIQIELIPFIKFVNDDINFSISKSLLFELDSELISCSNIKTESISCEKQYETKKTLSNSLIIHESSNLNSVSNASSTTSFMKKCQQFIDSTHQKPNQTHQNCQILKMNNLEEFNYFLNQKLMPNLQRIVDERDSYLESIIELEQDKDFLNFKLNQSSFNQNSNSGLIVGPNGSSLNQLGSDSNSTGYNEKQFLLDALNNLCIQSSNGGVDGVEPGNSLVNLSDSQTLIMLIESIYKEISSSSVSSVSSSSPSASDDNNSDLKSRKSQNSIEANSLNLLNDLKNRKLSNWNQKIALELVECKIKLKQLINEVEEKCEQIESLKDEIDDVKKQTNRLRNENVELQQKATLASVYSDELESLREKVI